MLIIGDFVATAIADESLCGSSAVDAFEIFANDDVTGFRVTTLYVIDSK